MTNPQISSLKTFDFEHIGWKYYNSIKKKAMEQEFSWAGLVLSLSIAFFITIVSAFCLSLVYQGITGQVRETGWQNGFYRLENINYQTYENYIQVEYISKEKIRQLAGPNLA